MNLTRLAPLVFPGTWLKEAPDQVGMTKLAWDSFVESMAVWALASFVVATGVIIGIYALHASNRRIHKWQDTFKHYWPADWLFLAAAPAAFMFWRYWSSFTDVFPRTPISAMGGALGVGMWTGFVTLVVSWVLICAPGVTPAKFRYRPLRVIYGKRGRLVTGEAK